MNPDMRALKQLPVILMAAALCAGAQVAAPGLPLLLESEGCPVVEQGVVTRRTAPMLRAALGQTLSVTFLCQERLTASRCPALSRELLPLRDSVRRLRFALRSPPLL